MTIDARFVILWDYEFFEKRRGDFNFRKSQAISLKLHTNILHPWRNFAIEFGQIDWSIQIFSDFEYFENFFKIF